MSSIINIKDNYKIFKSIILVIHLFFSNINLSQKNKLGPIYLTANPKHEHTIYKIRRYLFYVNQIVKLA
jgi:hypothetical protein